MLMGVVIRRRKYSATEYICVTCLTLGLAFFQVFKSNQDAESSNSIIGVLLLFFSLFLDGLVGPTQEKIVAEHHPSTHQMMFHMNFHATLMTIVLLLITGETTDAISFCMRHKELWGHILIFSLSSALGQFFIFFAIHQFSALTATTVTTTRKFFTILASVIVFGHSLTVMQWFGVFLVFAGLGGNIWFKYLKNKTQFQDKSTELTGYSRVATECDDVESDERPENGASRENRARIFNS